MKKTNFLARCQEQERKKRAVNEAIDRIIATRRLPKLVGLAIDCSPAFKSTEIQVRIAYAIRVLEAQRDPGELWKATLWDQKTREQVFGIKWELPVRVAWGIVVDLKNGRDVFDPSADDIRRSDLFAVTVKNYIPDGEDHHGFEKVAQGWIDSLIERHLGDLAETKEKPQVVLMSEDEMVQNMHPVARKFYLMGSRAHDRDFFETLSQILKAYKTKEEWQKSSWEDVMKKVPEYAYIGGRGRIDIDEFIEKNELFA